MGYNWNCLCEPILMAVPEPMLTDFCINHRLETCDIFFVKFCHWRCHDDFLKSGLNLPAVNIFISVRSNIAILALTCLLLFNTFFYISELYTIFTPQLVKYN